MLIKNIKGLLQVRDISVEKVSGSEMAIVPLIDDAYLLIEDGKIAAYGAMADCPAGNFETIDATGKFVLPTWCDSHTHIVYAGNREQEFVDRINGLTYEEIARRGGGILNSAKKLQETPDDVLYAESAARLEEVMRLGTGAVEIKSGYGLTADAELRMLRVIRKLRENYPVAIKSTFLGAHALPIEYKENPDGYIDLIIEKMLPEIAADNLADFIDVFCETGYFSVAQTERILEAGAKFGLQAKVHVNQFNSIGGVAACVRNNALSVDHLEVMNADDIDALKGSSTMPVALPSCSYFLGIPYTPAREIIGAGLPLALATDFNPGSSPSGNMNFVVSAACIKMKMTPEEALNAATINGAYAMNIQNTHGSITKGKAASVIITKPLASWYQLPYAFGSNLIEMVIVNGNVLK